MNVTKFNLIISPIIKATVKPNNPRKQDLALPCDFKGKNADKTGSRYIYQ